MGYEANDIQFSDDALGLGRALRLAATNGGNIRFSQDSDNADITIATFEPGSTDPIDRVIRTNSFTVGALGEIQAPLIFINAAANMVVTMPDPTANNNKYRFIRIDDTAYTVQFIGYNGTERFGGPGFDSFLYMKQAEDFEFVTDYTDWFI